MVYSSQQIAAQNAQFQAQMLQQHQYASAIGSGMPMAEAIGGGAINRMGAIGGPLAMGGLALAGLDPLSIGMSTAMGAGRAGMGFAGAGALGLGVGTAAAIPYMAASYAGNQFFQGAQQQQQFGQMMNSTFRFANNYGGHGFGRGGTGEIGGMMRQMTTEQGSMGQMVGFEELGRLASNMGRMGMAQGVRDAKEFSEKFREMVKTVKDIATQMGTNLEEAQKMMVAMKSSGVFGTANASMFASRIRSGSVAGGLATSELTGMMGVGSQISRMVGGRGRAGAAGGIETIANIGVAQQMGIMTEEDIYNTTGLTGAEGRRAMATRQMEQSAQFFKGVKGRSFLASIAGSNGQLDMDSVQEYLDGGVSPERTRAMYQKNLGKVGRANFIRNEGKLRGAALEQFGGLAPMIAMQGWLQERGINVNEDGDRAMLALQRQLGMGNSESEMMLRQVRELPQMLEHRKSAGEDDQYMQRMAERKSHTGLEGVKHKFEKARAEVNSVLQQAGANFYQDMTNMVEGFINRLTDTYVRETRADISNAFRSASGSGAMATQARRDTFGIGGGASFTSRHTDRNLFKGGLSAMDTFNKSGDAQSFRNAGFGLRGNDIMAHAGLVSQISNAFAGGDAGLSGRDGVVALGKANRDAFQSAVFNQGIKGDGFNRLASFGSWLEGQGGLGELSGRYAGAQDLEKAQILSAFSSKGGGDLDQAGNFQNPGFRGVYGTSRFRTVSDGDRAVGAAMLGSRSTSAYMRAPSFGADVGESQMMAMRMPSRAKDEALGSFMRSDRGRGLVAGMMNDDADVRRLTMNQVRKEAITLQNQKDRNEGDNATLAGLNSLMWAQRLTELEQRGASDSQLHAEASLLAKAGGVSVEDVLGSNRAVNALKVENQSSAREQAAERFGERSRDTVGGLERSGLVTGSGANLSVNAEGLSKLKLSGAGGDFVKAMVAQQASWSQMGPGNANNAALEAAGFASGDEGSAILGRMTVKQQRELASGLSGVEGAGDWRATVGRVSAVSGQLQKGGKGAKGVAGVAGALGSNLTPEMVQKLLGKGDAAGIENLAKTMAADIGGDTLLGNKGFLDQLKSSIGNVQGGKFGAAGVDVVNLQRNDSVQKARVEKAQEDPNFNLKNISEYTKKSSEELVKILGSLGELQKSMKERAEDWNPLT